MTDHTELILDGTKLQWHWERVEAWERGERIAPITIDMALTRACNSEFSILENPSSLRCVLSTKRTPLLSSLSVL